jgi:hypothetical protein
MLSIGTSIFSAPRQSQGATPVIPGQGGLLAPFTFSRAHTPSTAKATYLTSNGLTWAEAAQDVARYNGTSERLLIAGQRTNAIRNPRAEGGTDFNGSVAMLKPVVAGGIITSITIIDGGADYTTATVVIVGTSGAGSGATATATVTNGVITAVTVTNGGTGYTGRVMALVKPTSGNLPTNWTSHGTMVSRSTYLGLNFIEMTWRGQTAGASGSLYTDLVFDSGAISAAQNQFTTMSFFAALTAGDTTNLSVTGILYGTPSFSDNSSAAVTLGDLPTRFTLARSFTAVGTTGCSPRLALTATGDFDITLLIAWPQCEVGAFASSPILPVVGTPVATTRTRDIVTAPLSSFSIPTSGAGTYLMTVMIPQAGPSGVNETIMQIDDGTSSNRYVLRTVAGGSGIVINRVNGGSGAGDVTAGTMTLGTLFRVGVTLDGAGRFAASFNGNTVVSMTGGPTTGLTTLRLGSELSSSQLFGEIGTMRVLPYALTDANLQTAVAAL